MTSKKSAKKLKVIKGKDITDSDKRIPRNLIIKYGDEYYILKAGLEWKANDLFGGAGYSLRITPEIMDYEKKLFVFRAVLKVLENGATYINYGEAKADNVNRMMTSQLLHLAVTRAECRVLRMATACGYASYDEVKTISNGNDTPEIKGGDKPATKEQLGTIKALKGKAKKGITKQEASELIRKLSKKK